MEHAIITKLNVRELCWHVYGNNSQDRVRRRYRAGLRNFFTLYKPLAMSWQMYENSGNVGRRLLAAGRQATGTQIDKAAIWQYFTQEYGDGD